MLLNKNGKTSGLDMEEDDLPLLPNTVAELRTKQKTKRDLHGTLSLISFLLNFILLGVVVYSWPSANHLWRRQHLDPSSFSPAYDAVEEVPTVFQGAFLNDSSPYQGWPDDDKDQLWQDMYSKGMAIRIDKSAASQLINKTERIAQPGLEQDHVVGLDVFHQLHCLNMLRQAIYPQRYNSSIIRKDGSVDFMAWAHLDHCVESLRESLTCSADISAVAWRWLPKSKIMEPELRSVHMCRNFTKIRDWAFDRFTPVANNRAHVEDGVIVDYSGTGKDPEKVVASKLAKPAWWNKTVNDL